MHEPNECLYTNKTANITIQLQTQSRVIHTHTHTHTHTNLKQSFEYYLRNNFIDIYYLSVNNNVHFTYFTIKAFVVLNCPLFQNNK